MHTVLVLGSQSAGDLSHSHVPGSRLPLLSNKHAFTLPVYL